MRRQVLATCFLMSLSLAGCQGKPRSEFKVPPEEASRENPEKPTTVSIAEGNQNYLKSNCVVCHAKNGSGKGFMSGASAYNCRDWRDPGSLKDFTDGELFYIINKGKGNMPAYERRMSAQDVWLTVDYIRSLAKQSP